MSEPGVSTLSRHRLFLLLIVLLATTLTNCGGNDAKRTKTAVDFVATLTDAYVSNGGFRTQTLNLARLSNDAIDINVLLHSNAAPEHAIGAAMQKAVCIGMERIAQYTYDGVELTFEQQQTVREKWETFLVGQLHTWFPGNPVNALRGVVKRAMVTIDLVSVNPGVARNYLAYCTPFLR